MEYLVITKDNRMPPDIENERLLVWDVTRFWDEANSDDGLTIPEGGVYYNLDSLTKDIYEGMRAAELPVKYYRWSDQNVVLDFDMFDSVIVYDVPQVEEEPEEEEFDEIEEVELEEPEEISTESGIGDVEIIENPTTATKDDNLDKEGLLTLIGNKFENVVNKPNRTAAKTILFGSSKGGTGKTTTCLISVRRYAKTHPHERVAIADFDVVDGQVGISILKPSPTLRDYYKQYKHGNTGFEYLNNVAIKSDNFSPNLDFYLAPPLNIPEVTNDDEFWKNVFELLIMNYDTVFFDSGIDYLGQKPISKLYSIVDKIILTCNTSVNAVNSVVKQIQTLKGEVPNNVFKPENKIGERTNVVLTRVMPNSSTNDLVIEAITDNNVPIVAAFGNLDELVNRSQWYQQWEVWDRDEKINEYLDRIVSI